MPARLGSCEGAGGRERARTMVDFEEDRRIASMCDWSKTFYPYSPMRWKNAPRWQRFLVWLEEHIQFYRRRMVTKRIGLLEPVQKQAVEYEERRFLIETIGDYVYWPEFCRDKEKGGWDDGA